MLCTTECLHFSQSSSIQDNTIQCPPPPSITPKQFTSVQEWKILSCQKAMLSAVLKETSIYYNCSERACHTLGISVKLEHGSLWRKKYMFLCVYVCIHICTYIHIMYTYIHIMYTYSYISTWVELELHNSHWKQSKSTCATGSIIRHSKGEDFFRYGFFGDCHMRNGWHAFMIYSDKTLELKNLLKEGKPCKLESNYTETRRGSVILFKCLNNWFKQRIGFRCQDFGSAGLKGCSL